MKDRIETMVRQFWEKEISQEMLISEFHDELTIQGLSYQEFLKSVVINQDADVLAYLMDIGSALGDDDQFMAFVHDVIGEPWHRSYEEMAHFLQGKKRSESINPLKKAMQRRYDFLESYGTGRRQFINQCGHALWSIGTQEAMAAIWEMARSEDPVIRDEMLYRISRIEGKNNYERHFEWDEGV